MEVPDRGNHSIECMQRKLSVSPRSDHQWVVRWHMDLYQVTEICWSYCELYFVGCQSHFVCDQLPHASQ